MKLLQLMGQNSKFGPKTTYRPRSTTQACIAVAFVLPRAQKTPLTFVLCVWPDSWHLKQRYEVDVLQQTRCAAGWAILRSSRHPLMLRCTFLVHPQQPARKSSYAILDIYVGIVCHQLSACTIKYKIAFECINSAASEYAGTAFYDDLDAEADDAFMCAIMM